MIPVRPVLAAPFFRVYYKKLFVMLYRSTLALFLFSSLCRMTVLCGQTVQAEFIYDEAPFPSCHASTIAETPTGLVAAWFGGTAEKNPDVGIWVARRLGGRWTEPVEVANGVQHADKRYPCWNPVLFFDDREGLLLFYKVGPSPSEWWGELIISRDNGETWSAARRLPEDILGPVKNKPVRLPGGALLCPSSTENDGWTVHLERLPAPGATWQRIGPLESSGSIEAIQPSILLHAGGALQLLCRSKNNRIVESWSNDGGLSWSPLTLTALANPNSGIDAVTLADGSHLLVYNPTEKEPGKWGGDRYPLVLARSHDGREWSDLLTLESEPGEYSYPAIIQGSDGTVHITYTWRRKKIKYVRIEL